MQAAWLSGGSGWKQWLQVTSCTLCEMYQVLPHFPSHIPAPTTQLNTGTSQKAFTIKRGLFPYEGGDAQTCPAVFKAVWKIIGFSGSISGGDGVTVYSETQPVPGESWRNPRLLSVTNWPELACAPRMLARQPGSLHNSTCVSPRLLKFPPSSYSAGENSSYLFSSAHFLVRGELWILGNISKIIAENKSTSSVWDHCLGRGEHLLPRAQRQTMQNMVL